MLQGPCFTEDNTFPQETNSTRKQKLSLQNSGATKVLPCVRSRGCFWGQGFYLHNHQHFESPAKAKQSKPLPSLPLQPLPLAPFSLCQWTPKVHALSVKILWTHVQDLGSNEMFSGQVMAQFVKHWPRTYENLYSNPQSPRKSLAW